MSKLDELIGVVRGYEREFNRNAIANYQKVLGKERLTCANCGHCPSALLEELEAAREALSNADVIRIADTHAAKGEERRK